MKVSEVITKLVIGERGTLKLFECANCDFTSDDLKKSIKHNKKYKHEFWVKRVN